MSAAFPMDSEPLHSVIRAIDASSRLSILHSVQLALSQADVGDDRIDANLIRLRDSVHSTDWSNPASIEDAFGLFT